MASFLEPYCAITTVTPKESIHTKRQLLVLSTEYCAIFFVFFFLSQLLFVVGIRSHLPKQPAETRHQHLCRGELNGELHLFRDRFQLFQTKELESGHFPVVWTFGPVEANTERLRNLLSLPTFKISICFRWANCHYLGSREALTKIVGRLFHKPFCLLQYYFEQTTQQTNLC